MSSKTNSLQNKKKVKGTPPSTTQKYGLTTLVGFNKQEYRPLAFGLSVFDDLDLVVLLQAKANVSEERVWSDIEFRFLIYVIDEGEIIESPISAFTVDMDSPTIQEERMRVFVNPFVAAVCVALAERHVNPYMLRDSHIPAKVLAEYSRYNKGKMVLINA